MKKYIKTAGYHGYSMSNNAVDAYENGEKPLSKWTKADILSELTELGVSDEILQVAKKLTLADLKAIFLYKSSWHHTSKMYNKTDFYSVNPDVSMQDIRAYLDNRSTTTKENQPEYAFCEVSYGEWEGSRSRPKLKTKEGYAIVINNWAFVYADGVIKKKKVSGSHFEIIYTYSKIPTDKQEIYDALLNYIKQNT